MVRPSFEDDGRDHFTCSFFGKSPRRLAAGGVKNPARKGRRNPGPLGFQIAQKHILLDAELDAGGGLHDFLVTKVSPRRGDS